MMADNNNSKRVFVTVGTTRFDKLILTICDLSVVKVFQKRGYGQIVLQIGAMQDQPVLPDINGIKFEIFKYKDSIASDFASADLVISHAGAGSCLEALGAKKPLIVVINEDLMDNHQIELADQLHRDQHVFKTTCGRLLDLLSTMDLSQLRPFAPGHPEKFASLLDTLFGFS